MSPLEARHRSLLDAIARSAGARPAVLLAVSKAQPAEVIRALAALGQRAFGENYAQEALTKQRELADLALEWHLIGPLQSNKCRAVARHFDWVQSVDRAKLLHLLDSERPAERGPLNVLLQVNIDGEASKSGCAPDEVMALADQAAALPRLRLRGLMAIPEPHPDANHRRMAFAKMRALFEMLRASHPSCDTLSMGMSEDFPLALTEGSTLVRIGTALFGARTPSTLPPVAFIGGGNMARALIGGMIRGGSAAADIHISEPYAPNREGLATEFGVAVTDDNAVAASAAGVWILATKPQVLRRVCEALAALAQARRPLVVSIAAGISSTQIDRWLGGDIAVVRTMPNTPALLGAGVTGLYATSATSSAQRALADTLLKPAGKTVWITDEALMDTVTAVSGSGPAYVFLLAEAMQAAAQAEGLSADAAHTLVVETIAGAARMLRESGETATTLRQRVTSPNGTTQAALDAFVAGGFTPLVAAAIHAARIRGAELFAAND